MQMKKPHTNITPKKAVKIILMTIYMAAVFYVTLLNREPEPERMAWLVLFGSYKRAWRESHEFILWGLIDNVIMMIPFGLLLPWMNRRFYLLHTVCMAFVLTLFIESTQYLTRLGYFDVDDIWNNLWGTIIGYGFFCCLAEGTEAVRNHRRVEGWLLLRGILPLCIFLTFFALFLKMAL